MFVFVYLFVCFIFAEPVQYIGGQNNKGVGSYPDLSVKLNNNVALPKVKSNLIS